MNIINKVKELKQGECFLYNEHLNMCFKFKSIFVAAKNALSQGRHNGNGWKLIDDIENNYPSEEWKDLADVNI